MTGVNEHRGFAFVEYLSESDAKVWNLTRNSPTNLIKMAFVMFVHVCVHRKPLILSAKAHICTVVALFWNGPLKTRRLRTFVLKLFARLLRPNQKQKTPTRVAPLRKGFSNTSSLKRQSPPALMTLTRRRMSSLNHYSFFYHCYLEKAIAFNVNSF